MQRNERSPHEEYPDCTKAELKRCNGASRKDENRASSRFVDMRLQVHGPGQHGIKEQAAVARVWPRAICGELVQNAWRGARNTGRGPSAPIRLPPMSNRSRTRRATGSLRRV